MNSKNNILTKIKTLNPKKKDKDKAKIYQFKIKIYKKFFINTVLIFLIVLAGFQTWQLLSLNTKIYEIKSWQLEESNSQSKTTTSNTNQSSGGGVNSLPQQVGGC